MESGGVDMFGRETSDQSNPMYSIVHGEDSEHEREEHRAEKASC